MNKDILRALGFGKEVGAIEEGRCPFCLVMVDDNRFRDEDSRREFTISGLCQNCQDAMYTKGEE